MDVFLFVFYFIWFKGFNEGIHVLISYQLE